MLPINEIYCGNNIDLIKQLEDNSIDTIITSPPYGDMLGNHYNHVYDFESLAKEMHRVLKPGGILCWNEKDQHKNGKKTLSPFCHLIYFYNIGLSLWDNIIEYNNNVAPGRFPYYYQAYENIFILFKGNKIKNVNFLLEISKTKGQRIKDKGKNYVRSFDRDYIQSEYRRRHNVWIYDHNSSCLRHMEHEAKMNYRLCADLINSFSNPNELILDPFMGSGTTAIMCKELNRNYIGFEINEKFVIESKKYIDNMQDKLF